jgi:hypothetical protein
MATKFFTGLPLDGPDPECVKGHGETALAARREPRAQGASDHVSGARRVTSSPAPDHSWTPVRLGARRN